MSSHKSNDAHHHVRPSEPVVTLVAQPLVRVPPLTERIAARAYDKFISRGSVHGRAQEDWVEAERELNADA